jgi:2',3'-cyclic-nucleotide 2'-phosphodiesterase
MAQTLRYLIIGDVVGQAGQAVFQQIIPSFVKEKAIDLLIVNGENSAPKGVGITPRQVEFFKSMGVHVITSGNHIWDQREIYPSLNDPQASLIRPANFPSSSPGKGYMLVPVKDTMVAVINVQGRVFMPQHLDCPFKTVESLLPLVRQKTSLIFVDVHAEASSEKCCLGFFLDGKVSCVFGTHTHVQTADEIILPGGTAYITDVGFCGALYSSLGVNKDIIITRFLTQMPQRFAVEKAGPYVLHGIMGEVDTTTGKALSIERIRMIDHTAHTLVTD